MNGNDNVCAAANDGDSSRVYVHSWQSTTHASSNKAGLFIKRTNSILPFLVNEVIFESDFGDPVEERAEVNPTEIHRGVFKLSRVTVRNLFS